MPVPIKFWTTGVPVEPQAEQQLYNVAQLPFIHSHIAVMPDVHYGIGATVGSVIPTTGAIIPAAVGVDIGCGMTATKLAGLTANELPDNLKSIREAIEAAIPVGFAAHTKPNWYAKFETEIKNIQSFIETRHPAMLSKRRDDLVTIVLSQLGTLGGGNHFIELCLDEQNHVWLMLHSGSRGIGNAIGNYFITKAKEEITSKGVSIPDKNLAWFSEGTELFNDYILAVSWAQDYAKANRSEIKRRIINVLQPHFPPFDPTLVAVNCHHNYVAKEHHFGADVWITRKGAVSARAGELGIIPGSMGAKSFIVRGKGNPDSFNTCSHGAGRAMSRGEAKRKFTVKDHIAATTGVECRKDPGVIDETPGAYKDIDAVMAAQGDLVDIVHTLKQVLCVKG